MSDVRTCIGKRVVEVTETPGYSVMLTFDDGSTFTARHGDSGTMRDPEPYFAVDVLAADECRRWSAFGPCGQKMPCRFHAPAAPETAAPETPQRKDRE
jgi:hypothetical protein